VKNAMREDFVESRRMIAHIDNNGHTHDLLEHLQKTAELAESFASSFGAGEWARIAGLWHDLGKYSKEFQTKLLKEPGKPVNHSSAGGLYALKKFDAYGAVFAHLIMGHHAGLYDTTSRHGKESTIESRSKEIEFLDRIDLRDLDEILANVSLPISSIKGESSLWMRMLFSCLVDADYLDTESFFSPAQSEKRNYYNKMPELHSAFMRHMESLIDKAAPTVINSIRKEIFLQCKKAASEKNALFSLTVPTGGGKTLSSMAFALEHARTFGKKRIIYVIPYTSIIEQTAEIFRNIFTDAIIEHHSNFDPSCEKYSDEQQLKHKLASENWDAPIIVTTSVQFFESLFASSPGRCRKLHNIVQSVVIFDEAQLLPPAFLEPIFNVIDSLSKYYKTTFLFCTATQPLFESFEGEEKKFLKDLNPLEIVKNPFALAQQLQRVDISFNIKTPKAWEDLANELSAYNQVLCIVNRKDDCRMLWQLMPEGTFHLSTFMCAEHRSVQIKKIKNLLANGEPVRVISTQLVEAGVDIDFPVVYRAMAGLDSITQAAGRCNREGKLTDEKGILVRGQVKVFKADSDFPHGILKMAGEAAVRLLPSVDNILSPITFKRFFHALYFDLGERLDAKEIGKLSKPGKWQFRTISERFNLIDNQGQKLLIVLYKDASMLLDELEKNFDYRVLRKLQRYSVNLHEKYHTQLTKQGGIKEIFPGFFVQQDALLYDETIGLDLDKLGILDANSTVI